MDTTAWRSSSLDAGLADLEAMSAARQRPLSQLLLCFMSGNAFRRRGEIFCYRRLSLRLACPAVFRGRCGALRALRVAPPRQEAAKKALG